MRGIWKVLIFLVPALVIVAIALVAILGPRRAQEYVRATARTQAEQALRRPVAIGPARITRNTVTLERVVVRERTGGPVLARAARVTVHYSALRALLSLPNPLAAVNAVTITRPQLYLRRDRQGVWNVADLLRRPPRPARITARVQLTDGLVQVLDQTPPSPLPAPQSNTLRQVQVTIYLSSGGRLHLAGKARGPTGRAGSISGAVSVGGGRPTLGTITAGSSDLAYLWRYLRPHTAVQLRAGRGSLRASLLGAAGSPPQVVGQAQLGGTSLRLPRIPRPLGSARAQVVLAGQSLWLRQARAMLGQSPVQVAGVIANLARPTLALQASSPGLGPGELEAIFPRGLPAGLSLAGRLSAHGTIYGRPGALLIAGRAQAPLVTLAGVSIAPARSAFSYAGRALYLEHLVARVGGGSATGRAWVIVPGRGTTTAAFIGQASGVQLAALPDNVIPPSLVGIASGPLALQYRGQTELAAVLGLDRGRLESVEYDTGYAQVAYTQGVLRLPYARVRTGMGVAVVKGAITPGGPVDLRVAASEVSVAQAARMLGVKARVWGLGFLSGQVTGTTREPVFTGQVQGVNLNLAGNRVALASTGLRLEGDRLHLESGVLFYQGAEVAFAGTAGPLGEETVPLDISATVRQGSLGTLLALSGQELEVSGLVQGTVQVRGTLAQPTVRADLETFFPVIAGQPFDQGAAYFTYDHDRLVLEQARLLLASGVLTATGTVGPQGAVQLTIDSRDLDLARLALPDLRELGVVLSGPLTVTGRVEGTTRAPLALVNVSSPRFQADGQTFTNLTAQVRWTPGLITLAEASVEHGQATYTASGTVDTGNDTLTLTAHLNEASLAALRQIVQDRRARFAEGSLLRKFADQLAKMPVLTGDVTAAVAISGPTAQPAAALTFKVTGATLAEAPLPQVTGAVTLSREEVRISTLEARQGDSFATVTGTVSTQGPIDLDVDAFNLNARLFAPWLRLPVTGSADVTAVVAGTLDSPQLVGSAEIADVAGAGINLDRVRVTRFTLDGRRLELEDVQMVRGANRAQLSASLPVDLSPFGINREQPLEVVVELPEQDLALLSALLPGITEASGPVNGHVVVTGTAADPVFDGSLTITDGRMHIAGLARPVSGLQVRLSATGQTVTFEQFTAQVGKGAITVAGSAQLTSLDPDRLAANRYDLTALVRDLPISVPRALEGTANANLQLANPQGAERAVLTGTVRLSDTTIAVPPAGVVQVGLLLPPVDIALDVAVIARDDVWLRTPAANMQLAGTGHLGGTVRRPNLTAALESRRGTLNFPGGQFRVTFAAVDIYVPPPAVPPEGGLPVFSPRISLRAEAQATIQGYQTLLTVAGPVDNLQPQLRSIPELPQSELYALVLGVGRGPFELGQETRQLLTAGLGSFVARPLEQAIATGLGLTEFGFEFGVREPVRVRIGQYLLPNLYLAYLTSVAAPNPTWTLRATYEVTPSFWVGVSSNELQERRFEIQSIFRF